MTRGRVGAVLCVVGIALGLLTAPEVVRFASGNDRSANEAVLITNQTERFILPPHATYGIWSEDEDNSGYSEHGCSLVDDRGRPIKLNDSAWSVSTTTGEFEYQFDTGDGKVTARDCVARGAEYSIRPWLEVSALDLLGLLTGVTLLVIGIALLALALIRKHRPQDDSSRTRRLPWRWLLLSVTASVVITQVMFTFTAILAVSEWGVLDTAGAFRMAFKSQPEGLWVLLALLGVATLVALGRRQDRANLRREFTENSRTTLIVVPLIAWFVLAPLLMAAALLAPGVMEQW